MQEDHEAILEPLKSRRHRGAIKGRSGGFSGQHETHAPTFRHRVDHLGIIQHSRLHPPGRPACMRFGQKYAAGREPAHILRTSIGQHLALVQSYDMMAPLGFIQVGSAHEHREPLLIDELQDNCPQFTPRQRIDTDRGFV